MMHCDVCGCGCGSAIFIPEQVFKELLAHPQREEDAVSGGRYTIIASGHEGEHEVIYTAGEFKIVKLSEYRGEMKMDEFGFVEIADSVLRLDKIVAIVPHSYDSMEGRKNGYLVHLEGADSSLFISDMQREILVSILQRTCGVH